MTARIWLGGILLLCCVSASGLAEVKTTSWELDAGLGATYLRPGGAMDAITDMADSEFGRFRTAYGATSTSIMHWSHRSMFAGVGTVTVRRPVAESWGWQIQLSGFQFEASSSVDLTGTKGETLHQTWNMNVLVIPVSAGLWASSETPRGFTLKASAGLGVEEAQGELAVERTFVGGGRNDHYRNHSPLGGGAVSVSLATAISHRLCSWCDWFCALEYLAVAPLVLRFQSRADVNLDGTADYERGEQLADRTWTRVTADLSVAAVRAGLVFKL